jgi:histidinol dehydrogenase
VAFGDYLTGANHVLPTAGRARSFSGLSTLHYLRSYTIQEIDSRGASAMSDDVVILATAEGLPAHAVAAAARGTP